MTGKIIRPRGPPQHSLKGAGAGGCWLPLSPWGSLSRYLPVPCSRVLLAGADLNLAFGRRYGLVGRNGLGKTTLLKMIASRSLRIPSHISILHVEQEVAGDETPALQSVLECDTTRESLLREEKELTAKVNAGR